MARVRVHRIISLNSYFDVSTKEKVEAYLFNWLRRRAPMARVSWELKASQDWLKEWKKHFKPFNLAGFKIVPAWESEKFKKRKNMLLIEPGMAFGTGTHPTTRFAVQMLKKVSKKLNGKSVLDVGAGSGILSVVAEKLGAKNCVALDIDPESWRECRKTFKLNNCKRCRVTTETLGEVRRKFDVVVANIIDGVLMDMKEDLWRTVKPGGLIILSGILADGAKAFRKSFLAGVSWRVLGEISDGEWTSLLISK